MVIGVSLLTLAVRKYDQVMESGARVRAAQIAALKGKDSDIRGASGAHREAVAAAVKEPERLSAAFDNVERTAERWPSPKFILDNLPSYFVPSSKPSYEEVNQYRIERRPEHNLPKMITREHIEKLLAQLQEEKK